MYKFLKIAALEASGLTVLLSRMTIDEKCAQLGKLRGFNTILLFQERTSVAWRQTAHSVF